MAAIVAIYQRDGSPLDVRQVDAMFAATPHYAVDGADLWHDVRVALGHQHFHAPAQGGMQIQPISADAGRLSISADARIDNRLALAAQLAIDSRAATGMNDARLILAAYQRWGSACVDYLLGDFAFALWDGHNQQLVLARDALGARNLCYYVDSHCCVAATDVWQVLAHKAVPKRINHGKVAEYLLGLQHNQRETYFEELFYCPPGHIITVSTTEQTVRRYWALDPRRKVRYRHDEEYAEHYRELLTRAIADRVGAGAQVAISLSGGLDSTVLAALLAEQTGDRVGGVKSISYAFDELATCDERTYIRPVVARFGLDATYVRCDHLWTLRDPLNWPMDRGFVTSDPYALLQEAGIAGARRAGCQILVAGYYGDVLFNFGQYWLADLIRDRQVCRAAGLLYGSRKEWSWQEDLFHYGLVPLLPYRARRLYRSIIARTDAAYSPYLHPALIERSAIRARLADESAQYAGLTPDQRTRLYYSTLSIFAQGLAAVRKRYHAQGIELEQPYYDRRLLEFAMAIPAYMHGRPGVDRSIVRTMANGLLPEAVRTRRHRTSFLPLMERGLLEQETEFVLRTMTDPLVVKKGYVSATWLKTELMQRAGWLQPRNPFGLGIWRVLCLELWLRQHMDAIE